MKDVRGYFAFIDPVAVEKVGLVAYGADSLLDYLDKTVF